MFGKDKPTRYDNNDVEVRERTITARGGVSLGTIITGALVAIGAFFLLSSIVGAVLTATGVTPEELSSGEAVDAGIGGGIALLLAWFIAFTWGGYTAGRMGRGSGFLNGLLVPIGVILLAAAVGAIAWALGASEGWTLPSPTRQIQIEGQFAEVDYEIGLIAITLGVMFLGSIVGGILGARWHTKLERRVEHERHEHLAEERREDQRQVDLRDDERTKREHATVAPGPAAGGERTAPQYGQQSYPTTKQPTGVAPPPSAPGNQVPPPQR